MTNENAYLNMIKQQLRTGDVLDEAILAVYEEIPRKAFVPEVMKAFAYSDMQIPLDHGQRMMTPLEEGRILQALKLEKTETVLEIGTGTGYLTALLSRLCHKVISVDCFQDFTVAASRKLKEHQCDNVTLVTGDGSCGWLEEAPYDVIVMTGSLEMLTETHRLQLLPGGRLLAILGNAPVMSCWLFTLDHQGNWTREMLFDTEIPSLINKMKPKEFVF